MWNEMFLTFWTVQFKCRRKWIILNNAVYFVNW